MDVRDTFTSQSYYLDKNIINNNNNLNLQNGPIFGAFETSAKSSNVMNLSENYSMKMGCSNDNNISGSSNVMKMGCNNEGFKKKRGRPRKYGSNVGMGLCPTDVRVQPSLGSGSPKMRGRPPGSGWRQKLAPLGEWMNSSAGLAFTPHVIHIADGEDIAEKILFFSQQRPRVLCILTGHGSVSAVTFHQPSSVSSTVTYEGSFQILSLTGSYLVADSGVRNRTGGISVSLCSADGHVIGGAVSELIAAGPVQVVVSSFVYGGPKMKNKTVIVPESEEKKPMLLSGEATATPPTMTPYQNRTPNSSPATWPVSRPDMINP